MASRKKAAKKKSAKKTAKRKTIKRKTASKKKAAASLKTSENRSAGGKMSLAERRRALRKRRRTIRLKSAGTSITSVSIMAGVGSKANVLTRTRIVRKGRGDIGALPIDKNVMIKELIKAGSIGALADHFGVTKQAIGSWFGRRGLQAMDVTSSKTYKKEIM